MDINVSYTDDLVDPPCRIYVTANMADVLSDSPRDCDLGTALDVAMLSGCLMDFWIPGWDWIHGEDD